MMCHVVLAVIAPVLISRLSLIHIVAKSWNISQNNKEIWVSKKTIHFFTFESYPLMTDRLADHTVNSNNNVLKWINQFCEGSWCMNHSSRKLETGPANSDWLNHWRRMKEEFKAAGLNWPADHRQTEWLPGPSAEQWSAGTSASRAHGCCSLQRN